MNEYPEATTEQLITVYKNTDKDYIKRAMIDLVCKRNKGFIHIASLRVPKREQDDFKQHCYTNIVRAMDLFALDRGKFSSFLIWWLRASVSRFNMFNLIGTHKKKKTPGFNMLSVKAQKKYEKPSKEFKKTEAQVYLSDQFNVNQTFSERLRSELPDPLEEYEQTEKKGLCKELLSNLDAREKEIISDYFGLNGNKLYYTEIQDLHGISHERARQILRTAFVKLNRKYETREDIKKLKETK